MFVCLYHHSGQTSRWISLKLGTMIGLTQLKTWARNSGNGYHGNDKKPKTVFLPEKTLELQI